MHEYTIKNFNAVPATGQEPAIYFHRVHRGDRMCVKEASKWLPYPL